MDQIQDFKTFSDVRDVNLRSDNQSNVIVNMMEDNLGGDGALTEHGSYLILSYYEAIPKEERSVVYNKVKALAKARGLLS